MDSSTDALDPIASCDPMDNLKRDRFELLSAYLDGEVTATERHQVEEWLQNDATVQHLYRRLLKLRQMMRCLPVPASEQAAECTVKQVFCQVQRKRQRFALAWGGVAIAAMGVGFLSNLVPINRVQSHQVAEAPVHSPVSPPVSSNALMIALDQPVIKLSKVTTSGSLENSPVNPAGPAKATLP